jgi:hypothetical protein
LVWRWRICCSAGRACSPTTPMFHFICMHFNRKQLNRRMFVGRHTDHPDITSLSFTLNIVNFNASLKLTKQICV